MLRTLAHFGREQDATTVMFIVAFINLHCHVKITAVTACCNHFFIYSYRDNFLRLTKVTFILDNLLIVYIFHFEYFEDIYLRGLTSFLLGVFVVLL